MAAGGIGVAIAAAAGFGGLSLVCSDDQCRAPVAYEVCTNDGFELVEGMAGVCRAPADFAEFLDRPLVDAGGAPTTVSLSHPTDYEAAPETISTCAQYDARVAEGWYAMSGADRRREAYFERACGALRLIVQAQEPRATYFADGKMALSDVQRMPMADMPRIGPQSAGEYVEPEFAEAGPSQWKIVGKTTELTIQEIAHADFNRDGYGDVLVFLAMGARGGSAAAGAPALVEKRSADGPVRMRMR